MNFIGMYCRRRDFLLMMKSPEANNFLTGTA